MPNPADDAALIAWFTPFIEKHEQYAKLLKRTQSVSESNPEWIEAADETVVMLRRIADRLEAMDDREPITHDWLRSMGFQERSLSWSKLLPTIGGGAIVEFTLTEPNEQLDRFLGVAEPARDWTIALLQGLPDGDDQSYRDDHVTLTSIYPTTRGEVRRLLDALAPPTPATE
jgi:hypothetical protein